MEYQYPISIDWSTEEIIDVMKFFEMVEKAYGSSVDREEFMKTYKRFKEIVPSKSEEKTIDKEFEENSGFSTYRVVKKAKNTEPNERFSIKK
ncbi:UPF0223 family protein [Jeotgalibacillus proteolyticus]|uniref:UPF0223 protein C4B60_02125 n=1 Tax=Jeotgalibacillus proteolyticus TaxID=2082395 RepID=A0A2S5GHZ8_9BACL|nr:UPF0223 family protein [Jeotgalibacillus proteolyticus]PPA72493.1 hypothetical protein C4B60_02125 [Jeotgalibacillus proteolyticus]